MIILVSILMTILQERSDLVIIKECLRSRGLQNLQVEVKVLEIVQMLITLLEVIKQILQVEEICVIQVQITIKKLNREMSNNNFKGAKMKQQNPFCQLKLISYQHSIKIVNKQTVHLLVKFKDYLQHMLLNNCKE